MNDRGNIVENIRLFRAIQDQALKLNIRYRNSSIFSRKEIPIN